MLCTKTTRNLEVSSEIEQAAKFFAREINFLQEVTSA
jgi:hypothetical protein